MVTCWTKRWSLCYTNFCRHVANLVFILSLFWILYIGHHTVMIRSSTWIFCFVYKSNQVGKLQYMVEPNILILGLILGLWLVFLNFIFIVFQLYFFFWFCFSFSFYFCFFIFFYIYLFYFRFHLFDFSLWQLWATIGYLGFLFTFLILLNISESKHK